MFDLYRVALETMKFQNPAYTYALHKTSLGKLIRLANSLTRDYAKNKHAHDPQYSDANKNSDNAKDQKHHPDGPGHLMPKQWRTPRDAAGKLIDGADGFGKPSSDPVKE